MGTNYDVRYNICKCCGKYNTKHIGKSSAGWTFGFRAYKNIKSYSDWLKFLKGKEIFDEYDRKISLKDFKKLVESKRNEKKSMAVIDRNDSFFDKEKNSFTNGEFS